MNLKIYLLAIMSFFVATIFAQTSPKSFKIIENGAVPMIEISRYQQAIEVASMENFRFRSTADTLEFTNGLKFVMLSAHEFFILEKSINPTLYSERIKNYQMPKFQLSKEGTLMALYTHKEK